MNKSYPITLKIWSYFGTFRFCRWFRSFQIYCTCQLWFPHVSPCAFAHVTSCSSHTEFWGSPADVETRPVFEDVSCCQRTAERLLGRVGEDRIRGQGGRAAFTGTAMERFHAALREGGPNVPRMTSVDPDRIVSVRVRTGGMWSLCWKTHRKYFWSWK